MKRVIVPFFIVHQGCPHTCIFCNQAKISGGTGVLPDAEAIVSRIAAFRQTAGVQDMEVAFYGGTFTSLPFTLQEQLLSPLQPLLERGDISSVRISTRPDAVDRNSAEFLRSRGVKTIELGIQSLDDAVLVRAGRGHTARDAAEACRLLVESGFTVGLQLMPGLPGDTPSTAIATMKRAVSLRPGFFRIYPALVIAGTEMERMYRSGDYQPMTLSRAVSTCKVMLLEALRASIPVVRIGLQSSREIQSGGSVVAGPWHPAFRQLVEAELFFDLMTKLTTDISPGSQVIFSSAPSRVSDVTGQQRANIRRLSRAQGLEIGPVKVDPSLSPLELRLESAGHTRKGNMLFDLNYIGEEAARA